MIEDSFGKELALRRLSIPSIQVDVPVESGQKIGPDSETTY